MTRSPYQLHNRSAGLAGRLVRIPKSSPQTSKLNMDRDRLLLFLERTSPEEITRALTTISEKPFYQQVQHRRFAFAVLFGAGMATCGHTRRG